MKTFLYYFICFLVCIWVWSVNPWKGAFEGLATGVIIGALVKGFLSLFPKLNKQ